MHQEQSKYKKIKTVCFCVALLIVFFLVSVYILSASNAYFAHDDFSHQHTVNMQHGKSIFVKAIKATYELYMTWGGTVFCSFFAI